MCKSFCITIYLSVLLFSASAFAAVNAKKDQAAPEKKTQQPAKTEAKAKAQPVKKQTQAKVQKPVDKGVEKILGGTITTVDAAKKTVTVKVKSGEYPVSVETSTALVAGTDKISFAELKAGNYVTVKYLRFTNGSRKAVHVNNKTFMAAQAAKKAQEEKKAAALAAQKQKQTPVKKATPVAKKTEEKKPPAKVAKKPAQPAKKVEKSAQTKQPKPDQAHEK